MFQSFQFSTISELKELIMTGCKYFLPFYSFNAEHPWLQNAKKAPNVSLGETVKARLKQFSVMNKLKKRALKVMS